MSDNQHRFTFSSPSINNIIESAGYGDLNDPTLLDQHTGWTPLIKQSMAGANGNNSAHSNNNSSSVIDLDALNATEMMYARSNSIGTQYQQLMMNQMSSPSKQEHGSHGSNLNLDRFLAFDNEFMDSNSQFPLLLSTTPNNSRTNGLLLHDLFMDTPNLSNGSASGPGSASNNFNSQMNNNAMESPTKLMKQNILLSAQKRLTPYKLNPQNQPILYPETPGTKLMKSLLELPMTTTPLPSNSVSRLRNGGSPLKETITSATGNYTPLTKKSQKLQKKKRKAQDFETPKKKTRKTNGNDNELKQNFTPPQVKATGSSPSTIKVTSVSPRSKLKNKSNQQLSPTPATLKNSIAVLSSTENLQPPPIGTFKKEEKQVPQPVLVSKSSFNSSSGQGKSGKFQIIFQDVNSLMKKSLLKNKKARSKSGILATNNNKKNRLARSLTYSGAGANSGADLKKGPSNVLGSGFENKENEFSNVKSSLNTLKDNILNHVSQGLNETN